MSIPLPPLPDEFLMHPTQGECYTAAQMHAHAAAVTAAARDCRTCEHMAHRHFRVACLVNVCTNGDRYEPLPPVRLWRKA